MGAELLHRHCELLTAHAASRPSVHSLPFAVQSLPGASVIVTDPGERKYLHGKGAPSNESAGMRLEPFGTNL